MAESMLDVAYRVLQNSDKPVSFKDLIDKVASELGFSEEEKSNKMAQFYTNLSIDGRFVVLTDNFWQLRDRVPYKDAHIDMIDAYTDNDDDSEADAEDVEQELGTGDDDDEQEHDFDNEDADEDRKAKEINNEVGGL